MISREDWETLSYIVTVVGLPFAIAVFIWEQRRERANEDEEVYSRLADEYTNFQKLVLDNADLQLTSTRPPPPLTPEQNERKRVLFDILTSLFERAYILVFEERMDKQQRRLWQTWEDYMRSWCRREDYRAVLPEMLEGEDPDFVAHIRRLATEEKSRSPGTSAAS
jgi:hypothetical protein